MNHARTKVPRNCRALEHFVSASTETLSFPGVLFMTIKIEIEHKCDKIVLYDSSVDSKVKCRACC